MKRASSAKQGVTVRGGMKRTRDSFDVLHLHLTKTEEKQTEML